MTGIGVNRMAGVLASAVAKKIRPVAFPTDAHELPVIRRDVQVSDSQLVRLDDFLAAGTGSDGSGRKPTTTAGEANARFACPALLRALCFPATLDLLTSRALPVQPLGLVVTSQAWRLIAPVCGGEHLTLSAQVARLERGEDGVVIVVKCVLTRDGEPCYFEETRYLSRSGSGAPVLLESKESLFDANMPEEAADNFGLAPVPDHRAILGVNEAGRLDIGQRPALTTARFTPAQARQWAELTGDANPIHLSPLAAKMFGYRRVLLHGAAIDAWVASKLGINGESPSSGAVSFRAPVLLPVDLELVLLGEESFAVLEKRSGRDLIHLTYSGGDVEGIHPGEVVLPRQEGRVSSTLVAQGMCAGAAAGFPRVRNVIEESGPWRRGYRNAMESLSAIDAPQKGSRCARDGLESLHTLLHFADGRETADARMEEPGNGGGVIVGGGGQERRFELPFGERVLHGEELLEELRAWQASGIMRPAAHVALKEIVESPDLLDLSGVTFVCVGAGAELSPAPQLLRWGANVAAIMRPGSERARNLLRIADNSAGRLYVAPDDACDVVQQPERVAGWVADLQGRLVIVETLYAPGPEFLLASAGADVVEKLVCDARPDTMLAWIGSPTDAYLLEGVPVNDAIGASRLARAAEGYAKLRRIRGSRMDGVYPGFVDLQGPNYAAAKRIGRWRATVERAAGRQVSYNVGPMSLTRSVLNSGVLRAAYGGMEKLGMPALPTEVSASLMAGLLVWDLKHPGAVADSDGFLTDKAVDCGLFSSPYEPNGLMTVAVALGAKEGFQRARV